jgi:glycerol-3-phosphate cytidylyltransferase
MKRVMIDMSCTLLHHGHIRLLRKAADLGSVIVALTIDDEILTKKGYTPELSFDERKEILLAIKYVSDVIPSKWLLDDDYIRENNIDILVHGDDNSNEITACELVIFPRTEGISSSDLRQRSIKLSYENLYPVRSLPSN